LIFDENGNATAQQIDVIFPVLHGENGEDGTIQGLFALSKIPYVGCGVCAAACGMDKAVTKQIVAHTDVRQADFIVVRRSDFQQHYADIREAVAEKFVYPVFVKPCSTGSSVGVTKVKTPHELQGALENALKFDVKALIEEQIIGKEVEVAVLGNDAPPGGDPRARLTPVRISTTMKRNMSRTLRRRLSRRAWTVTCWKPCERRH